MSTSRLGLIAAVVAAIVLTSSSWAEDAPRKASGSSSQFKVHEWGTFTTLQNDRGDEVPGINVDDEPVPPFVHNLAPYLLNNPILSNDHWLYRQKGAPRQHPMVTMRLETPVLYFYPAADGTLPKTVDVDVLFRGGWLTEFYPFAKADLPGLHDKNFEFGPLTKKTLGRLTWEDVRLDTKKEGPKTDEHVWTAPRKVNSVDVSVDYTNRDGQDVTENERYLFYRGVAHQQAPLRVSTDLKKDELTIRANFEDVVCKGDCSIAATWLVDIRADGQVAYRTLPAFNVDSNPERVVATTSRKFSEGDYGSDNFQQLKQDMHKALVTDGLTADEATAMLATWERAYFKTAGVRMFFLVPRVWTDHYLPITISGAPETTRVMMGRIELVSDKQRELLKQVAKSTSDGRWIEKSTNEAAKERFLAGRSDFGDLGVKIPDDYQAYLNLGRFRNALVISEAKERPSPGIEKFINIYNIRPYKWAR